jgi:hypothetical protein
MLPPVTYEVPAETAAELEAVYRLYAALASGMGPDSGLGGKLLYAGELDTAGCRLARAANVAGAATLGASGDAAGLRQAMRDGVIDFLVTSLDEALRILKNQVRKREAVAVGVGMEPKTILNEMLERGVRPDLLPPDAGLTAPEIAQFIAQGARCLETDPLAPGRAFLAWQIPAAWAERPAEFDALLMESLPAEDHANRRWLRLSPRYLGAGARRIRSLECSGETAIKLAQRIFTADSGASQKP